MLTLKSLVVAGGLFVWAGSMAAHACDSDEMLRTEDGFFFKVIGSTDQVVAKDAPDGPGTAFKLDLLRPYYVICEDGDFYRVADMPATTVDGALAGKTGYVRKDAVYAWPTGEALNFSPYVWGDDDSPEVVAWTDESVLDSFLKNGDAGAYPPEFREDREDRFTRERALQPYPVLSSDVKLMRGTGEKRVFDVLLPANLPSDATIVINDQSGDVRQKLEDALLGATVVIAFDVTGSMRDFGLDMAYDMKAAFDGLPKEAVDRIRAGLIFFRDKYDDEKMFVVRALPVQEALDALIEAFKSGVDRGGGEAAGPVLDAVYYAMARFPWEGGDDVRAGGSRIIQAVLADDAKPMTEGYISDDVPAGIDAAALANQLAARAIRTLAVQVGPDSGGNLIPVLSTLADGTGGSFVRWAEDDRRDGVAQAAATALVQVASDAVNRGKDALSTLSLNDDGRPTLLLSALDGDKLNALREAGIKFEINAGGASALLRPGFMLENPDFLEPQIRIEKDTLDELINLFSILAATGVDADAMVETAGEAIAAIAGEDYDKGAPIAELIKKRLGISFHSPLLEYDLEYYASMEPVDRLGAIRRIQSAADQLSHFRDANLEAFTTNPAVWMPVSILP